MDKTPAFFNANGSFGPGAKRNPYSNSAAELLAHMNRLGITKSLVWHTAARDYNAVWGNKRLIEEIKAVGAENRLIPSFTISPVMLYEEGAMDALRKEMAINRVRALRVFPGTLNHKLSHIEPVLEKICELKPVLFFDCWDSLNTQELLSLAERFPDIPMVYMQGMWVHLVAILDLMRRRENILVDTSWLHTPHTIEMIVEKFGARHLLFGTGYKSHNGASLAALLHADISENDREFITHKNLETLLGLPQNEKDAFSLVDTGGGSLWNKLKSGKNIDVDVIDAHGHLGPHSTNIIEQGWVVEQVKQLIPIMDKMNIKTVIVSGMQALFTEAMEGNRSLEESLRPFKGRFLGYVGFNPQNGKELIPHLDELFSRDFFIGFKLHCSSWEVPLTDPGFKPVWEYADKHRLPILMHTWEGNYDSPALLHEIAPKFPDATFIVGHSGGGDKGRREAEALALENRNVILEFCGSFTSTIPYEETIEKIGNDRIVFGTDAMFHNPVWEIGRALSMNLPDEMLNPIMGENMRRILSLRR